MKQTKVNIKGLFQDKKLKDISKIIGTMDLGIQSIGFPMEFSYVTPSKVDEDYLNRLKEYLLNNGWTEDLICLRVEEISMSFVE